MIKYKRINKIEDLEFLSDTFQFNTNILIAKRFKFNSNCNYLFSGWEGNIKFEKGINTSKIKSMIGMFELCTGQIEGLEYFDTSNVTNINWMFTGVDFDNIKSDLTNWNLKKLKTADNIFDDCKNVPKKYIICLLDNVIKNTFCNKTTFKGE